MPYFATSQAFLEQSAQLLKAYPDTTRITTKYHFPTETPGARSKRAKSLARKESSAAPSTQSQAQAQPSAPVAALTLKTYNPTAGIVLQYQTNKIAEVGRLMLGLGKLASGADLESLGLSAGSAAAAAAAGGDVEMVDAPVEEDAAGAGAGAGAGATATATAAGGSNGKGQQQSQGGKGKKKGGKGKR
ncbi:hypothetical protein N7539_003876 [Penicillium diatomitis]|uniref:SRP9 domain-containing protein n=1 Tax=Penicillium diatomitis TaxID=2819901 RepID=A0A9W9XD31_9EURO|nr:uncharacterized protein N7539_003876 [Penicillium diatomitis]KAJ5488986.1 hypothetical protein N7539_003876 [Penicillium diatomitis]